MSDWNSKLQKAKDLFDKGLLDEEQYRAIQDSAVARLVSDEGDKTLAPVEVPKHIGAYEILSKLGVGGMGRVYRCRHQNAVIAERQGGDVAIKCMHPHSENDKLRLRFNREASMGLKLDHPSIVKVFDLIQDAGELLGHGVCSGQQLTALIEDGQQERSLSEVWNVQSAS